MVSIMWGTGTPCDAKDRTGMWLPAKVIAQGEAESDGGTTAVEGEKLQTVKVHFQGWNAKHDEWVPLSHLAPFGSRTSPEQLEQQRADMERDDIARAKMAQRQQGERGAPPPPADLTLHFIPPQRGRRRAARVAVLESSLIGFYSQMFPHQAQYEPKVIADAVGAHTSWLLAGRRGEELETLAGISFWTPDGHDFAVVEFIAAAHQRMGHGCRLLDAMLEYLRTIGREDLPVLAFADLRAVAFFKRNGFSEVEEVEAQVLCGKLRDIGMLIPSPTKLLRSDGDAERTAQLKERCAKRAQPPPASPTATEPYTLAQRGSVCMPRTGKQSAHSGQVAPQLPTKQHARGKMGQPASAEAARGKKKRSLYTKQDEKEYFRAVYGEPDEQPLTTSATTMTVAAAVGSIAGTDMAPAASPANALTQRTAMVAVASTPKAADRGRKRRSLYTEEDEQDYFRAVYGDSFVGEDASNAADSCGAIAGGQLVPAGPLRLRGSRPRAPQGGCRAICSLGTACAEVACAAAVPNAGGRARKRLRKEGAAVPAWLEPFCGGDQNEDVCAVCEEGGALLCCEGQCSRSFHLACIGLLKTPEQLICKFCTHGQEECFLCKDKQPHTSMDRCVVPGCGKYYCSKCVDSLVVVPTASGGVKPPEGTLICPRHMCTSCNSVPDRATELIRCVRCPLAYHLKCMPAGRPVTGCSLLCPKHLEDTDAIARNADSVCQISTAVSWNIDSCLICGCGGNLHCCDTCISSFHAKCIKHVHGFSRIRKTGTWSCPHCAHGLNAAMGAVIWARSPGMPGLWPAQVVSNAPPSIGIGPVGSFQVRFFGYQGQPNEWQWLQHSHTLQWSRGDEQRWDAMDNTLRTISDTERRMLTHGLQEATIAHELAAHDWQKGINGAKTAHVKSYRKILRNVDATGQPVTDRGNKQKEQACICGKRNPCGPGCLNRLCFAECDPRTCPQQAKCFNRRFQRRQYAKTRIVKAGETGFGLRANEPIHAGSFVIEYCGEVIDQDECVRRVRLQEQQGVTMFYCIALDRHLYVDATHAGNLSRYVNHSCEPNMRCEKWRVLGQTRVGFFALKNIAKGTELTIDYQFSTIAGTGMMTGMQKCSCGAARCRGFLGARVGGEYLGGRIRPEWCETLQVGMPCDVLAADGNWCLAKVAELDDRGGVTQLRICFEDESVERTDEWMAITDIMARMVRGLSCLSIGSFGQLRHNCCVQAPKRAFTAPEAVQRRKEQEALQLKEAAEANVCTRLPRTHSSRWRVHVSDDDAYCILA
jgi:GNAT superfamily N-acetyltransferase